MKIKEILCLISLLLLLPILCFSQEAEKPEPGAPAHEYLYWFYKVLMGVGGTVVVLGLVIAGLKFITSAGDPSRLADARDQAIKSLLGLLILILTGAMLDLTLGLKIQDIFKSPSELVVKGIQKEELEKPAGVYLTTSDGGEHYLYASHPKLLDVLEKEITQIEIVGSFQAVIFSEIDFKGNCEPFSKGKFSVPFPPFSIMIYSEESFSGNVTFYRKAFYNHDGKEKGEYGVGSTTGWKYLKDISFEHVPEDEKKCIEWKDDGSCKTKEEPTLKETTSIKIDENLSVLIVAAEKGGSCCQLFYDKEGKYSVANIKNEYIRAKNREPYLMKILPGAPY